MLGEIGSDSSSDDDLPLSALVSKEGGGGEGANMHTEFDTDSESDLPLSMLRER